jgi:hypothetical protein
MQRFDRATRAPSPMSILERLTTLHARVPVHICSHLFMIPALWFLYTSKSATHAALIRCTSGRGAAVMKPLLSQWILGTLTSSNRTRASYASVMRTLCQGPKVDRPGCSFYAGFASSDLCHPSSSHFEQSASISLRLASSPICIALGMSSRPPPTFQQARELRLSTPP